MKAVLVTGSRAWEDRKAIREALDAEKPTCVLVGDCPTGADAITRQWCQAMGVPCSVFLANWKSLGKKAGPMRNKAMVDGLAKFSDRVALAFPLGESPGTRGCIKLCEAAGVVVKVVEAVTPAGKL